MGSFPQINDFLGKRVHMVGIGGSSMSGLALLLRQNGFTITGSDCVPSHHLEMLEETGIIVYSSHDANHVHGADILLYSAAISDDNPERAEAKRLGIPQLERAVLLGQLMDRYLKSVAVCGTHGKTTTSAMLAKILIDAKIDPTVHIGGDCNHIGGSTRVGKGDYFLAEACEFNAGFINIHPFYAVVLNIDRDHLDFYRDIDEICDAFSTFVQSIPSEGLVIGCGDDERVMHVLSTARCRAESFGIGDNCDWRADDIHLSDNGNPVFTVNYKKQIIGSVCLAVKGYHNVSNALAAVAMATRIGVHSEEALRSIAGFMGVHRRFEHTSTIQGVMLYHDYGHNPAEMLTALATAKTQPHRRLWAVMQPHTYSRVKSLYSEYLTCTHLADITLVTDIFAAREKDPGDINARMLVQAMRNKGINAVYTPTFDDTESYLRLNWQAGDLVLTMGCGNIDLLNEQIYKNETARC